MFFFFFFFFFFLLLNFDCLMYPVTYLSTFCFCFLLLFFFNSLLYFEIVFCFILPISFDDIFTYKTEKSNDVAVFKTKSEENL